MKIIYLGSSSVCLELENDRPYYAEEPYEVRLNGEFVKKVDSNVVSLFGLKPGTDYAVDLVFEGGSSKSISVTTKTEVCCINVKDFGAKGDGVSLDTRAIQTAIDLLPPGGRLYFPAGTYLTLPLALRSHTTIEFSSDAVLLGSVDREAYPVLPAVITDPLSGREIPYASFEGKEMDAFQSLLYAAYAEDITIIGPGRVDGNAQNGDWWQTFNDYPMARPRVFFANRCENIVLHGLTFANSASWHLHPFFSKNVSILDCFITAPKISPNTDAIDPESCDYVNIIGCRFSVGDDCIAIKSGKLEMGEKYLQPADHHTVRNCLMQFGHGALTLGSEAAEGVKNLTVTRCVFRATDRGLRIKSRRGRGQHSFIDNVVFDNILMDKVLTPIVINMWYNCCDPDKNSEYVWNRGALPVDDRTPKSGTFVFRNMVCTDAEVAACYIDGLTESPIDEVRLEDISISFSAEAKPGVPAMENFARRRCRLGLYLDNVRRIAIKNVKVEGADGEKLIAQHYEELTTENF